MAHGDGVNKFLGRHLSHDRLQRSPGSGDKHVTTTEQHHAHTTGKHQKQFEHQTRVDGQKRYRQGPGLHQQQTGACAELQRLRLCALSVTRATGRIRSAEPPPAGQPGDQDDSECAVETANREQCRRPSDGQHASRQPLTACGPMFQAVLTTHRRHRGMKPMTALFTAGSWSATGNRRERQNQE